MMSSMLKKDLFRNKSVTLTLFVFIVLASVLLSSGSRMIVELVQSIHSLFEASKAPHVVQMHAGSIDKQEVEQWATDNDLVEQVQIIEMLNIDGSQLYMSVHSEAGSVMDVSFVTQSKEFDFLLNEQSEKVVVTEGQIAVPIYYKSKHNLEIGDKVTLKNNSYSLVFTVSDFVRDSQMNPALVHSKRFVVSQHDYSRLDAVVSEREYLLEFRLHQPEAIKSFTKVWQEADLPKQGPFIDYTLLQLLNGLGDGIIAAVIIMISIILIVIAFLCIRFSLLATMEEDYREIGVMKAIGISSNVIKRLYISKYVALVSVSVLIGYAASFACYRLFIDNILLYMGKAPSSPLQLVIPLAAVLIMSVFIVWSSYIVLGKFDRISAIEAIQSSISGSRDVKGLKLSVNRSKQLSIPLLLAIQDGWNRLKLFRLLFMILAVSTFIIIVPLNLFHTIKAPSFSSYMGIGQSDLRIDLRYSEDTSRKHDELLQLLEQDDRIQIHASFVTSQFKIANDEGSYDRIQVESGNQQMFPVRYQHGRAPQGVGEIALSSMLSKELNKSIGDSIILQVSGEDQLLAISGIYQDITNGGKTAKALFPPDESNILWYVIGLNLKNKENLEEVKQLYENRFTSAKVTDIEGYLAQTLGSTLRQLQLLVATAMITAILLAMLITLLFIKMLLAKDMKEIAILRSIGFSYSSIRIKYVSLMLIILLIAVIVGTVCANTIGERFVSLIMSSFGAERISFVIHPLHAYIYCPLLLFVVVVLTAFAGLRTISKRPVSDMLANS